MDDKKELMDTAMKHNRTLLSTVLDHVAKERQLSEPPKKTGPGLSSALPSIEERKALLDKQYHDRIKKVKMKYAGKMSPERMEELHLKAAGNIQPGAALAPSSGGVMKRVLSGSNLTPSPFMQNGSVQI